MFTIYTDNDLKVAMYILQDVTERNASGKYNSRIIEWKKEIRDYLKNRRSKSGKFADIYFLDEKSSVLYEDEYRTERSLLPKNIKTKEEAEQYFDENMRIEAYNSMYDCTNQIFTAWHSIFKVGNRFLCYHCTARDV